MFVRDGLTTKLSYGQAARRVGRELQRFVIRHHRMSRQYLSATPPEATVRIVVLHLEPASTQEHRQTRRSDRSRGSCWITHLCVEADAS